MAADSGWIYALNTLGDMIISQQFHYNQRSKIPRRNGERQSVDSQKYSRYVTDIPLLAYHCVLLGGGRGQGGQAALREEIL